METQKAMPADEPEYFAVTSRQPDGRNHGHTLESGKTGHPARMMLTREMRETLGFAI
jgi:hypothetical protein